MNKIANVEWGDGKCLKKWRNVFALCKLQTFLFMAQHYERSELRLFFRLFVNEWHLTFFVHRSEYWSLKLTFFLCKYKRFTSLLSIIFAAKKRSNVFDKVTNPDPIILGIFKCTSMGIYQAKASFIYGKYTLFQIFIFCPKIQLWFPEKVVDFLGEKLVKVLWFWTF